MATYFTVNGIEMTEEEMEEEDYLLCECGWAIHENEMIPCPNGCKTMCLYDWQDARWLCPICGEVNRGA